MKPSILFTTAVLEYPPAGGPYLRIANSIKALNQVSRLHLVSRVPIVTMGGQAALKYYANLVENVVFTPSSKESVGSNLVSNPFIMKLYRHVSTMAWYQVWRYWQTSTQERSQAQADAEFIIDYAQKNSISIIWFGYGNTSYHLIKAVKRIITDRSLSISLVVDTDSVWSKFVLRKIPLIKSWLEKKYIQKLGELKQNEERELVKWSDVTTAVSEIDAEYYRSISSNPQKIKIFSNVIDIKNYQEKNDSNITLKQPAVYLAGYFGPHSPTDFAARWFIEQVLPIILEEIPNLEFYIVGKGSDYTLADIKHPQVHILGQVGTVVPYLSQAKVAIVPLHFESGTRFKILEAGACHIPVVSTTLGAEGIPVKSGQDILIADTPQEFAQAVIDVCQRPQLQQKLGQNLHKLIQMKYSVASLAQEAQTIMTFLKR